MADLSNVHIACLATEGFEEAELRDPVQALRDAGAVVDVISEKREPIRVFVHHDPSKPYDVDLTLDEADPSKYDGVLLPGGVINGDYLRTLPKAREFVKAINDSGKPMAVICHAPWMLAETQIAEGRTLTSWPSLQTDLRNAGAEWVDREVCVDGNLVTSRKPDDIPAFNREFIALLTNAGKGSATSQTASADNAGVRS